MADTISNSNRKGKTNQSLEWLLKNLTKHCLTKLPSYRGRLPYWINIIYLPPGTLLLVFCAAFSCWLGQNPPLLRQKKKKHFSVSSVYNQLKKRKTTTKNQKTPQRMRCFFFFTRNRCMKHQKGRLRYAQSYTSIRIWYYSQKLKYWYCFISHLPILYSVHWNKRFVFHPRLHYEYNQSSLRCCISNLNRNLKEFYNLLEWASGAKQSSKLSQCHRQLGDIWDCNGSLNSKMYYTMQIKLWLYNLFQNQHLKVYIPVGMSKTYFLLRYLQG